MAYAQNKFYTSLIKQVTVFTCIYISMIAEWEWSRQILSDTINVNTICWYQNNIHSTKLTCWYVENMIYHAKKNYAKKQNKTKKQHMLQWCEQGWRIRERHKLLLSQNRHKGKICYDVDSITQSSKVPSNSYKASVGDPGIWNGEADFLSSYPSPFLSLSPPLSLPFSPLPLRRRPLKSS